MPPKKNNRRKYNRRRNYKKKSTQIAVAKRAARQVAYGMIPQKRCPNDGTLHLASNDPNSILIKPYYIPANSTLTSGSDEMWKRNGSQIFVNRTSGIFRLQIPETCVNPVDIRHICGWYKGSGALLSAGQGPLGTAHPLTAARLNETFHNQLARYDSANYKILTDRAFTVTPESIFDIDGSGQNSTMVGLWKTVTVKCNFPFNKRFKYADGKQGDDSEIATDGEDLVGWKPFIWLQAYAPSQQWDGGNQLGISYKFTTYFKDLN